MWSQGWRDTVWAELDRPWHIIVVGGGITGSGIFQAAAAAGLRVLLVEAQDFAAGTSSRSTKLVHGGLRYLQSLQIGVTRHSVLERERLLREGKGLVTPLGFLHATFKGDKLPPWVYSLALAVYDTMAMRWGHKRYGPEEFRRYCQELRREGLSAGHRFIDAQTDDARLTLRVLREGVHHGGVALNYARVDSLLRLATGRVRGVVIRDLAPAGRNRTFEAKAAVVVNATGAYADNVRRQLGLARRLRCLRGSHLVLPWQRLPLTRAVSFAHPRNQRFVLALPWEGVTLVGTTDVDHDQPMDEEPRISQAEAEYLLEAAQYAFPAMELSADDVQATFSGVRPVVNTGKADPSKESRDHALWNEMGLLTISGGKLTTFRTMAIAALNAIRNRLPGQPRFRQVRMLREPARLPASAANLNVHARIRLRGRYGSEGDDLVRAALPGELEAIGASPALWAELRWAARAEGVVHLEDLLLRRVRLGLLAPQGGLPWLEEIRAIVQPELGWDDGRWQDEVEAYTRQWRSVYSWPGAVYPLAAAATPR
jgi:glycerol-3-phosphate dehydrogenase